MKVVVRISLPKAKFVYPVSPAPPTAILVPWFGPSAGPGARVFTRGWDNEAAAYQPAAVAGTWPQMERLAADPPVSLTHALIVLVRPYGALLTFEQRRRLWGAFRVPVFEQMIGRKGLLVAAECEAHAGLHLQSPKLAIEGFSIERARCGCGRETMRLLAPKQIEEVRTVAALAAG